MIRRIHSTKTVGAASSGNSPAFVSLVAGFLVLLMWFIAALNLSSSHSVADVRAFWTGEFGFGISRFEMSVASTALITILVVLHAWWILRHQESRKAVHMLAYVFSLTILSYWFAVLNSVHQNVVDDSAYASFLANDQLDGTWSDVGRVQEVAPSLECESGFVGYSVELSVGEVVSVCIPVDRTANLDLIAVTIQIGRFSGDIHYGYQMSIEEADPELYWRTLVRQRQH